jgi:hypothetical protein
MEPNDNLLSSLTKKVADIFLILILFINLTIVLFNMKFNVYAFSLQHYNEDYGYHGG